MMMFLWCSIMVHNQCLDRRLLVDMWLKVAPSTVSLQIIVNMELLVNLSMVEASEGHANYLTFHGTSILL